MSNHGGAISAPDLGPQPKGGSHFQKTARLLQSRYRASVLKQPYGFGPQPGSKSRYGNMLVDGEKTGANFLTPGIFEYARKRVAEKGPEETIDAYRLFNNMLSSQPMCFNLFVPMKLATERGEPWPAAVFSELFPQYDISEIVRIELEYIPLPVSGYVNDKSAFDAFAEFRDAEGNSGVIGIETKYTDALGKNNPADIDFKKDVAERSGCFNGKGLAEIMRFCPQIVRNYLLTESFRMKHGLRYSHSLILSPEADTEVVAEMEQFKQLLNEQGKSNISKISLEIFARHVEKSCPESYRAWIREFRTRYLDFHIVDVSE